MSIYFDIIKQFYCLVLSSNLEKHDTSSKTLLSLSMSAAEGLIFK